MIRKSALKFDTLAGIKIMNLNEIDTILKAVEQHVILGYRAVKKSTYIELWVSMSNLPGMRPEWELVETMRGAVKQYKSFDAICSDIARLSGLDLEGTVFRIIPEVIRSGDDRPLRRITDIQS
jgi:hypothetical protein